MSSEWLPDGNQDFSKGGDPTTHRPYLVIPALVIGRGLRVNAAGWSDSSTEGTVVCKMCNKQVRGQLAELTLFPLFREDTDLLRFSYVLPPHRSGGGFSVEICRGSGSTVTRDVERPTSVRFAGGEASSEMGAGSAAKSRRDEEDVRRSEEELKKRLDALSPEEAEKRYDYLNAKSISELTDEEYEERLALALRLNDKDA